MTGTKTETKKTPYSHLDTSNIDAFSFAKYYGFKWIPTKDKRPLVAWKSKGVIYSSDDTKKMQEYRQQRITECAYPTEQNNLVVIDLDVVPKDKDKRSGNPLYKNFVMHNGNFMAGLINFTDLLRAKAKALEVTNEELSAKLLAKSFELPLYISRIVTSGVFEPFGDFKAICLTPSGGLHLYFKCDHAGSFISTSNIPNPLYDKAQTDTETKPNIEHVDVRAKGGIITAPLSSRRPHDKEGEKRSAFDAYLPLTDFKNIPPLPDYLAELLPKVKPIEPFRFSNCVPCFADSDAMSKGAKGLNKLLDKFDRDAVKDANRNTLLNGLVGWAFKHIKGVSPYEIERLFRQHARIKGLSDHEIDTVFKSARGYAGV